jgi:hypothetical protein
MQISRTSPYSSPITPGAVRPGVSPRPAVHTPESAATPAAPAAGHGATLWDLLTPEEQAFFSNQETLGALTYGPGSAARAGRDSNPAPLGGRIDVKA